MDDTGSCELLTAASRRAGTGVDNNTISIIRQPRSKEPASDDQSSDCSTVLPPHRSCVQKLGIHHPSTDPAASPWKLAPVSFVTAKRPRTAWYSVYCFITIILLPDQNLRPARRSPTLSQRRQPLLRWRRRPLRQFICQKKPLRPLRRAFVAPEQFGSRAQDTAIEQGTTLVLCQRFSVCVRQRGQRLQQRARNVSGTHSPIHLKRS